MLGKYIVKILFGWNNRKLEDEYLKKLERNWQKWKSVPLEEKSWGGDDVRVANDGLGSILFFFSFFLFYFIFLLLFLYSRPRQRRGYISHTVTIVSYSHDTEKGIEGSGIRWGHVT